MGLFLLSLLLPPVWLILSLPLGHRLDRVPVIKFISYLVSHLYLTALFIVCTVCPPNNLWESADLVPRFYEILLIAWLSGLVLSGLVIFGLVLLTAWLSGLVLSGLVLSSLVPWLSGLVVSQLTNPEDRAGLGWIKVPVVTYITVIRSSCSFIVCFYHCAFMFFLRFTDSLVVGVLRAFFV